MVFERKAHSNALARFGFALVFITVLSGGVLAVPLKKRGQFELENIYIPSALVMMLVLAMVVAALFMPNWPEAVHAAGAQAVWAGAACGFGWGVGSILFGYDVTMAGRSVQILLEHRKRFRIHPGGATVGFH